MMILAEQTLWLADYKKAKWLWEGVEAKALPAQGKSIQLTVSVA